MEIILAIVVASAVIFFGALISMGNERQRKAIDSLREQVALWAIQDLRIKREGLAREASVKDPLEWFNQLAAKAFGLDLKLKFIEAFEEPKGLVFISEVVNTKIVFSTLSPRDINSLKATRRGRLSHYVEQNPLLSLPRAVKYHEFSVLNCEILFDLELPQAWKKLSGQYLGGIISVWVYQLS